MENAIISTGRILISLLMLEVAVYCHVLSANDNVVTK